MKARIAIACIAALVSTAVSALAACGSEPPVPTPIHVPTATATATPRPTATPYLGGIRPIYDVKTKEWVTVTPTPTATPTYPRATSTSTPLIQLPKLFYDKEKGTYVRATQTAVPPTVRPDATPIRMFSSTDASTLRSVFAGYIAPTATPTVIPTSAPIPTPTWNEVWDGQSLSTTSVMRKSEGEFEPLTDKNMEKAREASHTGILNGRRLSDGDKRSLGKGLREYDLPAFVHRCLTDELEYPALTRELEKQREFYGWERLDFIRDGSSGDFLYYVDSFTATPTSLPIQNPIAVSHCRKRGRDCSNRC